MELSVPDIGAKLFENLFEYGSPVGVLLLAYSMNVAIETLRISNSPHGIVSGPAIARSGLATLFSIAALPCIIWPAIYVGGYDGVLAAVIAWIGLQVLGAVATIVLKIRGGLLGFHVLAGMVALPVGYFLTLTSLPW